MSISKGLLLIACLLFLPLKKRVGAGLLFWRLRRLGGKSRNDYAIRRPG